MQNLAARWKSSTELPINMLFAVGLDERGKRMAYALPCDPELFDSGQEMLIANSRRYAHPLKSFVMKQDVAWELASGMLRRTGFE